MQIKFINKSNNELPKYETKGAAGMDLRAFLNENVVLKPMDRVLIATGLFMEIPIGFEAQIRPRSGLAFKNGITLPNTPATIDADYRGEIKIPLINLSTENQTIKSGERIAQLIINKIEQATIIAVNKLSETERNIGGFGSTGKN